MKGRIKMNIKDLRTQTKMSQSQFAKYFNIPPSTLKKWEQGQRKCPEYLLELIEYKLQNEGFFYETIHVKIPQSFDGDLMKEVKEQLSRERTKNELK